MKQLKSSLGDLRRIFVRTLTLREIAEPLVSYDHSQTVEPVLAMLNRKEFDVVGVREHGVVTGYALRSELGPGELGHHQKKFEPRDFLPDSDPLHSAFEALRDRRYVFITVLGQVGGIVTRGDLQKAPVRLWLFGLISLLEMQMLRVVRERFPQESWKTLLSEERVNMAQNLFKERQRRQEENGLSDCLQFGDKGTLLMKDPVLFQATGFESKRAVEIFFKEVGTLRNSLAHSNTILSAGASPMAELVGRLENLLERLEQCFPTPFHEPTTGPTPTGKDLPTD